jgi:hypothetical protein
MKKTITYTGTFLFSLLLLACSKSSDNGFAPHANPDQVISAKVAPGQTYSLDVALRGKLSIARQAAHYSLSETGINDKNGYLVYKYISAPGFTGDDEVVLSHVTEAAYTNYAGCNYGGSQMTNSSTSIVVRISVAE